jgi:DNA-binding response OmpR family regulator
LILLVEDEALIRETVTFGLEEAGFEVVALDGAGSALDLFEADGREISCLVTNVNLGTSVDGFELARIAIAKRPGLPVIYITGGAQHRASAEMIQYGKLVAKPFKVDELVDAIRSLKPPPA